MTQEVVYTVQFDDFEGSFIQSIHKTRAGAEKALEAARRRQSEHYHSFFSVQEEPLHE